MMETRKRAMGTRSGRRKEFGPSSSTGWTPSPPPSPEESRGPGNESGVAQASQTTQFITKHTIREIQTIR